MDPVSTKIVDPPKLKRVARVHESVYALNKIVICVEFIEDRWPLDQVNIDLTKIIKVIY